MAWLHAVIDTPESSHEETARFWERALGWPAGAAWDGHPELRSFEPAVGEPYLHLQEIDGDQRVHIDVEVDDPEAAADRAVQLGAEPVAVHDRWQTLRSPGGLLFCLLRNRDRTPPAPVTWPDGHRSRLVQVCIDSPGSAHDREVAFWQALLPGRWVGSGAPEFAGKWHDDAGSPLQLLFQRLDEPTAGTPRPRHGRPARRGTAAARPRRHRPRAGPRLARPPRPGRHDLLRHRELPRADRSPRPRVAPDPQA
jgi:hypothetical protein